MLTDFIRTGVYDKNRPFLLTMSPSMDILVSSNLERMLYLLTGDHAAVAGWMRQLSETGRYDVGDQVRAALEREGFIAFCADEDETARTIRGYWEKQGYLADPHTAVGLSAARAYKDACQEDRPCVVLSTASPFKFAPAMLASLGRDVPADGFRALTALSELSGQAVPGPLAALREKTERFPGVVSPSDMSAAVEKWLTE